MSTSSTIEWTDATWNPTTGCDRVSPGCDHCYAQTLARRLKAMGSGRYQADGSPKTSGPGFGLTAHWDLLALPERWLKPRMIFVNSMSDLFHPAVPEDFLKQVFSTMSRCPRHTFQVLTKRHRRMRTALPRIWETIGDGTPLPNVWLGTSVENQAWAERRLPLLDDAPAAIKFISCEPLLGPVDLAPWLSAGGIDWVIVGGESGPGARPMDPEWARSLRNQCVEARVSFFFKQWGGRTPKSGGRLLDGKTWNQLPNLKDAYSCPA